MDISNYTETVYGEKTCTVASSIEWNKLPGHFKTYPLRIETFKKSLKTTGAFEEIV